MGGAGLLVLLAFNAYCEESERAARWLIWQIIGAVTVVVLVASFIVRLL